MKIWGPFGAAKSQVWHANVGTYQTAKIHLAPLRRRRRGEAEPLRPAASCSLGKWTTRRAQTDAYEAVVEGDGCLTHLRVDGVEFLKPGVGISRGAYFHQQDTAKLPDVSPAGSRRDHRSRRESRDPL